MKVGRSERTGFVPASQLFQCFKWDDSICEGDTVKLLLRWLINAGALMAVAYLVPGVKIESFVTALIIAVVLGLVNAVIRPILVILTLPATVLTLGLFLFVINGLMFWLVAEVVKGFTVTGFWAAFFGALVYSAITLVTSWIFFPNKVEESGKQ
jgi:putative membrane protein